MADRTSRLCRLATRNLAILTERPGVPGVVLFLTASLLIIRAGLFPGTGGDDGEQLVFSQFFDWGYQVRNPPLYTWLVIAVSQVTGPTLWAVNIIKFALLAGMYVMLWRAAHYLIRDERLAALAGLAPVLFYYIAWEVVTGFSHTVLAACLYAALIWVVLRLRDAPAPRLTDYVFLGVVIALGAMAKYAFWIFLTALLAAAMLDAEMRRRLISPMVLLSLAVAAVLAAPHYLWLFERLDILAGQAGETASAGSGINLRGLGHGAKAALGFLAPFWVIALICFPAAFLPRKKTSDQPTHPMVRVIGWQMVVILVGTAVGALLLPDFRIRTHYMVVLMLFPLWVLARVEMTEPSGKRLGVFAAFLSLALFAGPVGMAIKYVLEPWNCGRCQHHIPYPALADKIRALGFTGGTILAHWHPDPLPGNLRAVFPEARVISMKHMDVIPPRRGAGGQCLILWSADAAGDKRSDAIAAANTHLAARIGKDEKQHLVIAPLAGIPMITGGKTAALGAILLDGRGDCR